MKSDQESVMDRLRNRRGLRSRSRKSHVGANMLDAAGFTEDEKLEAFRIYDETLKADREREERQMREALDALVDDQIAQEAEETLRTTELNDEVLDASYMESEAGATSSSTSSSVPQRPVIGQGDALNRLRRRIGSDGEPESDEELRKRIMEEFLKDSDRVLEGREGERERQKEAMRKKLEEQRRRTKEKLVEDRVAREIRNATTNERLKDEEEEAEDVGAMLKEAVNAIETSRQKAVDGEVADNRRKWDKTAMEASLNFAKENQVITITINDTSFMCGNNEKDKIWLHL